jgi:uncharacterized protein YjbI with pentapeptide repeats
MCVFFCTFAAKFNYSMAFSRTYYRVAEHLFAVECSDSALLSCMTNYEPFAVEINNNDNIDNISRQSYGEADRSNESEIRTPCRDKDMECEKHSTPIFTLRVEGNEAKGERREARGEEWTHVVTDNAQADMPRVEVYRSSLEDASLQDALLQDASLQDASLQGASLQDASLSAPQKSADFSGTPLQSSGREWLFRVAVVANAPICCEMECNQDFTEGVLYILPDCQDIRFCIDNALMLLYAFRTAPLMTLEMHAAVVVRPSLEDATLQDASLQAKGYLFLGHSGTGKSTHARQWLAAFEDAWLLNDDNPILRVMPNGEVRVYGSPWSGKTACYHNDYATVGGIVKLSQAPHNKIQTISLPEAYAYMLSSASGLKMDPYMADYMYESIKHVITHVKCYHMECLPNTEAAEIALRGMV